MAGAIKRIGNEAAPPNKNNMKTKQMDVLKYLDDYRYAPASVVQAADKLISLSKTSDKWTVIEEVIKVWESTNPTDYESYLVNLDDVKETRKTSWVGHKEFTGVSRKDGAILRYTVDIPMKVIYMIRKIYPELEMDREFFDKFARKFPKFKISEVKG